MAFELCGWTSLNSRIVRIEVHWTVACVQDMYQRAELTCIRPSHLLPVGSTLQANSTMQPYTMQEPSTACENGIVIRGQGDWVQPNVLCHHKPHIHQGIGMMIITDYALIAKLQGSLEPARRARDTADAIQRQIGQRSCTADQQSNSQDCQPSSFGRRTRRKIARLFIVHPEDFKSSHTPSPSESIKQL